MSHHTDPAVRLESHFAAEEWSKARRLIQRELHDLPKSTPIRHWWLTRLGTTYYEQGHYQKALDMSKLAEKITPTCPLVLWDKAGALDMLKLPKEAAAVYQKLIDLGEVGIAADPCGEGLQWASELITDCYYRQASCLMSMDNRRPTLTTAHQLATTAVDRVKHGQGGIYSLAECQKQASEISDNLYQTCHSILWHTFGLLSRSIVAGTTYVGPDTTFTTADSSGVVKVVTRPYKKAPSIKLPALEAFITLGRTAPVSERVVCEYTSSSYHPEPLKSCTSKGRVRGRVRRVTSCV